MTIKWNTDKMIEMNSYGVGIVIDYYGEKFEIVKIRKNGYGGVEIRNYRDEIHGLSDGESAEILTTFNL